MVLTRSLLEKNQVIIYLVAIVSGVIIVSVNPCFSILQQCR